MVTYIFLRVSTLHCPHDPRPSSSCKSRENHRKGRLAANTEGGRETQFSQQQREGDIPERGRSLPWLSLSTQEKAAEGKADSNSSQDGTSRATLFWCDGSDRTRGDGHMKKQEILSEYKKPLFHFTVRVVKHWNEAAKRSCGVPSHGGLQNPPGCGSGQVPEAPL